MMDKSEDLPYKQRDRLGACPVSLSRIFKHADFSPFERLAFFPDQQTHAFGRLAAENGLSTTGTDHSGDILYQRKFTLYLKYLVHRLVSSFGRAANMALEHDYLRFSNAIHSRGSGSYKVMIRTCSVSA